MAYIIVRADNTIRCWFAAKQSDPPLEGEQYVEVSDSTIPDIETLLWNGSKMIPVIPMISKTS